MKYLKEFKPFCEEHLSLIYETVLNSEKEHASDLVATYTERKNNVDLNKYYGIFKINKSNQILSGQLFLSYKSDKAIRVNFLSKNQTNNSVESIDLWNIFKFDRKPDYTLIIKTDSIIDILPDIARFFSKPKDYLRIKVIDPKQEKEPQPEPQQKEIAEGKEEEKTIKASISDNEIHRLDSNTVKQEDLGFDVFKSIELYTAQVAKGISNSLIIT